MVGVVVGVGVAYKPLYVGRNRCFVRRTFTVNIKQKGSVNEYKLREVISQITLIAVTLAEKEELDPASPVESAV